MLRVDASSQIGLGHLMRCISLAEALTKQGLSCHFAVNQQAVDICQSRPDWGWEISVVPYLDDTEKQLQWLQQQLEAGHFSALVLDGYHFDQSFRQALNQIHCFHVCFDDTNQLSQLHTDLVINGASNAEKLNYQSTATDAVLCLGEQYRVLRGEFTQPATFTLKERSYLTITMGGSDPFDLTLPLLQQLQRAGFGDTIQLITGAAYPVLAQLNEFLQQSRLKVKHSHNCQSMAQIFNQSRLVISAAGGSQFELQACGCPSLLLVVADNQFNATNQAATQGWCELWDMRRSDKAEQIEVLVEHLMILWQQQQLLEKMSQRAYQTRDIQGAQRVANAIILGIEQNEQ
ncbi:UDP-2,4-diacetamido-2,4,6-trideoxy-beta-L-altropyranose hydrolase [Aliiglaciecola sp. LCG003]|uniref:UDP-2,4-diacetamido-2,4, 6-trideoxy-beta-L-altropyranose hydrolase n=1 Tax=Aliiglaciecola sp. LCG003 TaxID=3053655 RepID=UPI0025741A9A|nr:UDP-2,4-diacetamido-2,4,6-trideoxy-beta-L-altropyranose hydrolase [Aliiglaciecola sp. LCG003]WJG11264.1 UDP-2,4-diacetamido-2,4,6-trideoxy-beta-L-altropyranose hydrolase [Aliiglaciecola sp. LCG003]